MKTHIQLVAAFHIALGAFSLVAAFILFAIFGMAGGIVLSQGQGGAAGIVGIVGLALCGFLALVGLPGVIGGWAVLTGRSWGRPLLLVLGVLDLFSIPFGTALGIYTLWALLQQPQPQSQSPAV